MLRSHMTLTVCLCHHFTTQQGLSSMQKKYYKWILTRDVNKLTKGTGGWGLRRGGNR